MKSLTETRSGGDPDDPKIVFTDLTPTRLEKELDAMGTPAGDDAIREWMDELSPDRDAQFKNIAQLIDSYVQAGNPYFSIDSKAREFQGELYRAGRVRCSQAFRAFDHDFPSWAEGVIIPHGIFDPVRNRGHINIGLSHDTTKFACDSIRWYWNRIGQQCYPDEIGIPIRVAHYPSYCSKYNPIERRFFPHVSRACTGMLFDTLERAVELMRKASTSTGLKTTVNVINKLYETGRNATDAIKDIVRATVKFHDLLPNWNYAFKPQIGH